MSKRRKRVWLPASPPAALLKITMVELVPTAASPPWSFSQSDSLDVKGAGYGEDLLLGLSVSGQFRSSSGGEVVVAVEEEEPDMAIARKV